MSQPEGVSKTQESIRLWLGLVGVSLASFLTGVDVTLVGLALPSIQRDFHVTLAEGSWVINAYTLSFAALVVTGGKLGDIWGRKRVLLLGFFVFGLGALFAGVSSNIQVLLMSRAVQGIGAAMMVPGSLAVLTADFYKKNLSLAIGIWGAVGALGLLVGPIVSGGLTFFYDWRAIFLMNVPIALVAILVAYITVRESMDLSIARFVDIFGIATSAGAIVLLTLTMMASNDYGWISVQTGGFFIGAVASMILFVFVERKVSSPILDFSFFLDRPFTVGLLVRFTAGFAFVPVILMSTIYLQNFLHESVIASGIMVLPAAVVVIVGTLFWGKVIDKVGPRVPMFIGMTVAGGASLIWLGFDAQSGYGSLLLSLLMAGFGGSAAFVSTTAIVVRSLGVNKVGVAAGLVNMVQNVSGALGVAAVSATFLSSLRRRIADELPSADYYKIQTFGPDAGNHVQGRIFADAMSDAALVVAAVLLLGIVVSMFCPKAVDIEDRSWKA